MSEKTLSYQELSAELDAILEELQSGELDIDEATAKYERGIKILSKLETYLKTAENKVKKIKTDLGA